MISNYFNIIKYYYLKGLLLSYRFIYNQELSEDIKNNLFKGEEMRKLRVRFLILTIIFMLMTVATSIVVFAQDMNTAEAAKSSVQSIEEKLRNMSPLLLIGLGILLIFIQKFAKLAGIILLIIGFVRLIFMFMSTSV